MKKESLYILALLSLLGLNVQASTPKSVGNDLVCEGSASISTPHFTCSTPYGLSDRCTKESAEASFDMNIIRGNLAKGLAGTMTVSSIYSLDKSINHLEKKMIPIINSTSLYIAYKDKKAKLVLHTALGSSSIEKIVDFSVGSTASIYVGLLNSDEYGMIPFPGEALEIGITVFCTAGNRYNNKN